MAAHTSPTDRIKLEDEEAYITIEDDKDEDPDVDHCSICLQPIADRTVIPECSHEFCFECLLVWTEQSRRCPLCSGQIGEYVIHNIRSNHDFQKHYLTPLRTSPRPQPPISGGSRRRGGRREIQWGRTERRAREAADELERAIEKRRWVYRHHLYAKHVASNSYTRYRPFPTPSQFAANADLIARATTFIRRELRVWDSLDVEFLTTFTVSLMKSLDIRSESAIKLLAEFLDMDAEYDNDHPRANAEHFAHELYSYLRSPFRVLTVYDSVVQYDAPSHVPPHENRGSQRWRATDRSLSRSRSSSMGSSDARAEPARASRRTRSPEDSATRRRRSPSRQDLLPKRRRLSKSDGRRSGSSVQKPDIDYQRPRSRTNEMDSDEGPRERDIKGKGRASEGSHSHQSAIRESSAGVPAIEDETKEIPVDDIEHGHEVELPPPPHAADEKPRARPKIRRDVWQSVQAQLASSSSDREAEIGRAERICILAREELSIRGAASKLSSSIAEQNRSHFTLEDQVLSSGPTPSPPTACTTMAGTPAALAETPTPSVPRMSPQEIMARTRARLARMKAADGDGEPGPCTNKANSTSQPRTTVVVGDGFSNASSSQHMDARPAASDVATLAAASPPSGTSQQRRQEEHAGVLPAPAAALRAKLLSKLQDERRVQLQAGEDDADGPQRTRTRALEGIQAHMLPSEDGRQMQNASIPAVSATVDRASPGASTSGSISSHLPLYRRDAEMRESKLRAQAQLHVKLAAAKRQADHEKAHVSTDISSRETLLRARLKRSR